MKLVKRSWSWTEMHSSRLKQAGFSFLGKRKISKMRQEGCLEAESKEEHPIGARPSGMISQSWLSCSQQSQVTA